MWNRNIDVEVVTSGGDGSGSEHAREEGTFLEKEVERRLSDILVGDERT